jgi:hypothetical protein
MIVPDRRQGIAMLLGGAFVVAATLAAPAQTPTPEAFLDGIYKTYLGKNGKGVRLDSVAAVRGYFAPRLATAILKDRAAAAKRQDVPTLDGDPFVDAQDWEIDNLAIDVKPSGAKAATATVGFTNFGEMKSVAIDLVRLSAGWRITEIKAPSGSLRALMKVK